MLRLLRTYQWVIEACKVNITLHTCYFLFQVGVDKLKVKTVRARIPSTEQQLMLNSRRLTIEDAIKCRPGVQFFWSCLSGYMKGGDTTPTFWVGFYVAYVEGDDTTGDFVFRAIHDAGLVLMTDTRKSTPMEQLATMVKDNDNACVQVWCRLTSKSIIGF